MNGTTERQARASPSGRSVQERWAADHEAVGATLAEPGHDVDSDEFGWAGVECASRHLFLAVVCDGVGSSTRKAEASRLAVRSMLHWARHPGPMDGDLAPLLSQAVASAHGDVRDALGGGGLSTMVAVLVDRETRKLVWASVGDSTVFLATATKCEKLNPEDKTVRPRKPNGQLVLVDGVPFMDHGLTQALGQLADIAPRTGELEYVPGTLVALASDGVKESYVPAFLRTQGRVSGAAEVHAFCDRMRRIDKTEDSTFVLLRLGVASERAGRAMRKAAGLR